MFQVIENKILAPKVHQMVIQAPRIAKARKPGQFVIVHCHQDSERIPLTIADANLEKGTITLIIQAIGSGTQEIVAVNPGENIQDVAGPLGFPTEIHHFGKVVCIGGGVGTAVLFPLAKALSDAGNEVTTIIGGRSESFIILKNELAEFSKEVLVSTEDGSMGTKGFVTNVLGPILENPEKKPAAVFAVGPLPMMAAIAKQTQPFGVKTIVSLNPIMVDGTGMCGGCRVTVGGQIRFACVDGPEFDGHQVDFKELANRLNTYTEPHTCKITGKFHP